MEQNVSVARGGLEYTAEERAFLERERVRLAEGFCAQCGECRGQCPRRVDVPTLMRTHMYAYDYRNLELAMTTHGTIPRGLGPGGVWRLLSVRRALPTRGEGCRPIGRCTRDRLGACLTTGAR